MTQDRPLRVSVVGLTDSGAAEVVDLDELRSAAFAALDAEPDELVIDLRHVQDGPAAVRAMREVQRAAREQDCAVTFMLPKVTIHIG